MMFRTHPEYESKMRLPSALFRGYKGTRHWRAFEIVFNDFWFLGEFLMSRGSDDESRWHTFAAYEVNDLIVLASEPQVREHRLNLVIPTHQDHEGQLRLMPLREIFRGTEPEHRQTVFVYVTNDDARYVSSSLDVQEANVIDRSLLYSKQNVNVRPFTE